MSAAKLAQHLPTRSRVGRGPIPQYKISAPGQVMNNAGGFTFALDKWSRLDRFLILGSEGGTFYVSERKMTQDNAKSVIECIKEDGIAVVDRIVEISDSGRAPKNDPALMALALCATHGTPETKRHAMDNLSRVARIGTHLFHFAEYASSMRGWGRLLKEGVAGWYQEKTETEVATQAVKYQQRDGWSHRDLLRLSHPMADTPLRNNTYRWMVKGRDGIKEGDAMPEIIIGAEMIKDVGSNVSDALTLINEYKLPRESVPTHFLNDPRIWDALMSTMKPTALIRNLGKMTSIDLMAPGSAATVTAVNMLTNMEALKKARVHPISILLALKTYSSGQGFKGSLTWRPVPAIVQALNEAFYLSFGNVTPTGVRILLGMDISGSMSMGSARVAGTNLLAVEATAAMAMVTARIEELWYAMAFTTKFEDCSNILNPQNTLDVVVREFQKLSHQMGRTDCAMPMVWAAKNNVPVDTFVIYTDNETWAGPVHPHVALKNYREKTGLPARLIVAGTTATDFTIADPNDNGMLDVVGFDSSAPEVISAFAAGLF